MARIFFPANLNREIANYAQNRGNYLIDYRGGTTRVALGTSFSSTVNSIEVQSPLAVNPPHISGDDSLLRTFFLDFIVENNRAEISEITVLTGNRRYVEATLWSSEYVNGVFVFTFRTKGVMPTSATGIKPVNLSIISSDFKGVVDKLGCHSLRLSDVPGITNISRESNSSNIVVTTAATSTYPNGSPIPTSAIPSFISNITAFYFSIGDVQVGNSKLAVISRINSDFTTNNAHTLPEGVTNYGHLVRSSLGSTSVDGYNFSLGPSEKAYLSLIMEGPLTEFTTSRILSKANILVGDGSTGDGSSPSLTIKTVLPSSTPIIVVPKDDSEDSEYVSKEVDFYLSINNANYEKFTNILSSNPDSFINILRTKLEPLDFYFFKRKNGYWTIHSFHPNNIEIRSAYYNYDILPENDISRTESYFSSTKNIGEGLNSTAVNTASSSIYELYEPPKKPTPSEAIYLLREEVDVFRIAFKGNASKSTLKCMLPNIDFKVENLKQSFFFEHKTVRSGTFTKVDFNFTSSSDTDAVILESIRSQLATSLGTNYAVVVKPSNIISITNKGSVTPFFYNSNKFVVDPLYPGLFQVESGISYSILSKGG